MTEQAAKLIVKVKLHAAQPVVLPTQASPARLSKFKVFLGVLVLLLLTAAGYFLWQQFVGKVPTVVAAEYDTVHPAPMPTAEAGSFVESGHDKQKPASSSVGADPQATDVAVPAERLVAPQLAERQPDIAITQPENQHHDKTAPLTTQTSAIQVADHGAATQHNKRNFPEGFSRIVLAATMEQLEPGDAIDKLVAHQQIQRLYLFTELKGYAGQQLIHRWTYKGQVQTEALLTIEDSPWRTYSEKWLLPDQLGNWRVEIVDQQQNVLYQHDFQYQ